MASITIAIWVDSDGNVKVMADDYEAFSDLDDSLAVRKVVLSVEVPEPSAETYVEIGVPAVESADPPAIKVSTAG